MVLLVTGGAGFIGANFIFDMLRRHADCRIVCLDKLTYAGRLETLAPVMDDPRFRFVRGDIADREAVLRLMQRERPDAVVNFAAESHVDRSIEDPGVFLRTNILGTAALMDACLRCGTARFHQVSTDEVYGDLPLDQPGLRFGEQSPLRASSPYAASKASADLLVMAYVRTYGLNATISRSANNYGPHQHGEKLIPRMIACALAGEPLPVYGTGENVRDWLHVTDHCAAIDLILRRGRAGEIYNVGAGCERSNIDLVRMICRELGCPQERIALVPDRPGHDLRYAVDTDKIRRELGWRPQVEFEQGMRETIRWYAGGRG
ncbi:MAG: dTDP-glucose 4,6-dehydratase [Clostridia bacterium]|nr:dTDP-glucose 4,6-dehydratase [Clostridia bacterium]